MPIKLDKLRKVTTKENRKAKTRKEVAGFHMAMVANMVVRIPKGKKGKGNQQNGKGKGGGQDRNTHRVRGQQGHWGESSKRNGTQTVTNQTQNANSVAESETASSTGGKARSVFLRQSHK